MKEIICQAIKGNNVISFNYENEQRIVEPFAFGIHKDTGNSVLRSFRVGGYSKSEKEPPWRLFIVDHMSELQIVPDRKAEAHREFYNPEDKHMSEVICCKPLL